MTTTATPPPAGDARVLVQQLEPDLAAHVRANPVLALAADARLTTTHLKRFVRGELAAQSAEVVAFAQLVLRSPPGSAQQELFLGVLTMIAGARPQLLAAAQALEVPADGDGSEIPEGAARYAEFISWVGLNAAPGAAAAAVRDVLVLWCAACAELSRILGPEPPLRVPEPVQAFVAVFAQAPPATIRAAEDVIVAAIEAGEPVADIARVAGRAEPVLNAYWRSIPAG